MGFIRKEPDHEFYLAVIALVALIALIALIALVLIQAFSCWCCCLGGSTVTQNTIGRTGDIAAGQDNDSGCTGIKASSS